MGNTSKQVPPWERIRPGLPTEGNTGNEHGLLSAQWPSGQLPAATQMGEFSFTVHPYGNTNRGQLPCLLLLWWSTLTSGFRRKFHFHVFLWGDCLGTENRVLSGGNEMTACPLLFLLEQQTKASVSDTNQKKLPTVQMLLFAWQSSNKAYATVNTGKL